MLISTLPPWIILDPLLQDWLREDLGRGDRTTQGLFTHHEIPQGTATWIIKENGVIAGLPLAHRVFQLLDPEIEMITLIEAGIEYQSGVAIARFQGRLDALLMGERTALNLVMRLSGIATATRQYTQLIADLPTKLVDTRKTTPGMRILEKYATQVGGAINHRLGLDDAVMIKDNHIQAAGSIQAAISQIRQNMPYPLTIEVETSNLKEVQDAIAYGADIIMLDNMSVELMTQAVKLIRQQRPQLKIEASGNITLSNLREIALTGVDYISTSAPITRSNWLDISMRIDSRT